MFIEKFKVDSPNVKYTEDEIHSIYNYETTELVHAYDQWIVKPRRTVQYEFRTQTHVPKLGIMLVGWGGSTGSTLTGGLTEKESAGSARIRCNKLITLAHLHKLQVQGWGSSNLFQHPKF